MYIASADTVLREYEAITQRHTQNIIDAYHALPWWSKLFGWKHAIAKKSILKCWQLYSEMSDI